MRVHHQIDFTLEIFDSITGGVLKGGHGLFYLNGLPLRPGKVVESYMIFSNVFNDPRKIHVTGSQGSYQLTWHHPFYASLEIKLVPKEWPKPDQAIVIAAKPSMGYPVPSGVTGIKGKSLEGASVRTVHTYNANRFRMTEVPQEDGTLHLSQSLEQRLDGKLLRVSSGSNEQTTFRLGGSEQQWRMESILEGSITAIHADSDIFELLEVPIQAQGAYLLLLPNIRTEDSTLQLTLEIVDQAGVILKSVDIAVEKGKLTTLEE